MKTPQTTSTLVRSRGFALATTGSALLLASLFLSACGAKQETATPAATEEAAAAAAEESSSTMDQAAAGMEKAASDAKKMATDAASAMMASSLKTSFTKDGSGDAPMVLHVKNGGAKAVKVSGKIVSSVAVHNQDKTRDVEEQTVAPGGEITIKDLAPEDTVTLMTEGSAPVVVKVPFNP